MIECIEDIMQREHDAFKEKVNECRDLIIEDFQNATQMGITIFQNVVKKRFEELNGTTNNKM